MNVHCWWTQSILMGKILSYTYTKFPQTCMEFFVRQRQEDSSSFKSSITAASATSFKMFNKALILPFPWTLFSWLRSLLGHLVPEGKKKTCPVVCVYYWPALQANFPANFGFVREITLKCKETHYFSMKLYKLLIMEAELF